jgi:ubiquitin C-terminal hydrolase
VPFVELAINLNANSTKSTNGSTRSKAESNNCKLLDQLKTSSVPELMDGDNAYKCPTCNVLRPAEKATKVSRYPPVMHFALMRFVYDMKSKNRKKVKTSIEYPKVIELESSQGNGPGSGNGGGGEDDRGQEEETYDLRGIITHIGTSVSCSCTSRDLVIGQVSGCLLLCKMLIWTGTSRPLHLQSLR